MGVTRTRRASYWRGRLPSKRHRLGNGLHSPCPVAAAQPLMLRRFERLLDLRPGELERGVLLFAYLFLVIASFVVGQGRPRRAVPRRVRRPAAAVCRHCASPPGRPLGVRLPPHRAAALTLRDLLVGSLRVLRRQLPGLLVSLTHLRRAMADSRHLRLGRDVRRRRAGAGLDAGQLRADDARGQADVRVHRQRRDGRLDRRRLPDAGDRHAVRRREHAGRAWRSVAAAVRAFWSADSGAGGRSPTPKSSAEARRAVRRAASGRACG